MGILPVTFHHGIFLRSWHILFSCLLLCFPPFSSLPPFLSADTILSLTFSPFLPPSLPPAFTCLSPPLHVPSLHAMVQTLYFIVAHLLILDHKNPAWLTFTLSWTIAKRMVYHLSRQLNNAQQLLTRSKIKPYSSACIQDPPPQSSTDCHTSPVLTPTFATVHLNTLHPASTPDTSQTCFALS